MTILANSRYFFLRVILTSVPFLFLVPLFLGENFPNSAITFLMESLFFPYLICWPVDTWSWKMLFKTCFSSWPSLHIALWIKEDPVMLLLKNCLRGLSLVVYLNYRSWLSWFGFFEVHNFFVHGSFLVMTPLKLFCRNFRPYYWRRHKDFLY